VAVKNHAEALEDLVVDGGVEGQVLPRTPIRNRKSSKSASTVKLVKWVR